MRPADPDVVATPHSRVERAGAAIFVVLLVALTLPHPSTTRIHTWPWALLAALCWLIPPIGAIAAFARGDPARWPDRLVPAGLLLLVASAVLSALLSPFPAASLPRIWPTVAGTALVYVLHQWLARPGPAADRSAMVGQVIAGVAAAVVAFSLLGWSLQHWPVPWVARNGVPFGHSIYTAGFVVIALPWIVWAAWQSRAAQRFGWSVAVAAALTVLASTSSRGGVLVIGAVAAVAAGVILLRARWSLRRKAALAAAVIGVAAVIGLANPRLRGLLQEGSWSDAAHESNVQRQAMLAAGMKLGGERPWLGWGPGTVPLAYPSVRARLDGGVDNVLQLHNTPVQLWATLGLAGVAAGFLLAAGVVHAAVVRLRAGTAVPEVLAALASLGGYALFTLTDHQFDVPLINAVAAANLALVTAVPISGVAAGPSRRARMSLVIGLASGLMVFSLPLLRELQARQVYESGLVAWEHGRTPEFIAALDRAAALVPADPFYLHQAAAACLRAREAERDRAKRAELGAAAEQRLEASLRTGAHLEFAHFNLGWLNLELGRPAAAANHFVAVAKLVPDKGGVYFGLGLARQGAGDADGAIRAFALEWVNDPLSMSSPAWEVPPLAALRHVVRAETLRLYSRLADELPAAAAAASWARWWLGEPVAMGALVGGFSADARAFAKALPAIAARDPVRNPAPWAQVYSAWRDPDALDGFTTAAGGDIALATALQRRARRHRSSFQAFLTAPTEDEPALLQTYRRERTGYGVLALHPDGPVLIDDYIVQRNRVAAQFASTLLPPKGWLPGRYLLALLPPPRALAAAK